MTNKIELVGQTFGRLIVLSFEGKNKENRPMWLCKCECGNEKVVLEKNLKNGGTKSCGCLVVRNGKEKTKHNMTDTPTWKSWRAMMKRCYEPSASNFSTYGGKGISVESRWHIFQNFLEDMGERKENMSIDRINTDLGYFKENCRWASNTTQNNNRGDYNTVLTLNGVSQTQAEWAKQLGIKDTALSERLRRGWSIEKALTTPVKEYKKKIA